MNCVRCDREIARGATYWAELTGWAQKRTVGGTNHVALREDTGRLMCDPCMHLEKNRINRGQTSLG